MIKWILSSIVILTVLTSCASVQIPYLFRSYEPGVETTATMGNEVLYWETGMVYEASNNIHDERIWEMQFTEYNKESNLVFVTLNKKMRDEHKNILVKPYEKTVYECNLNEGNAFLIEGVAFVIKEVNHLILTIVVMQEPKEFTSRIVFKNYDHLTKRVNLITEQNIQSSSNWTSSIQKKDKDKPSIIDEIYRQPRSRSEETTVSIP